MIKKITPKNLLVAEIWQGHLEKGANFFQALIRFNEIRGLEPGAATWYYRRYT